MFLNAGNYQEQVPSWLRLVIGTKGRESELSRRNCSFHYQLLCTILIFKYVLVSCLENLVDRRAWKAAVHGVAEGRTRLSNFFFLLPCIGEGNGNPLQCSCLENPRDGGRGSLVGCCLWGRTELDMTEVT